MADPQPATPGSPTADPGSQTAAPGTGDADRSGGSGDAGDLGGSGDVSDLGSSNGQSRRRTPSQDRSRETFEAIVAAAADLIEESGIQALNTNAVAERAGVSITAVYAYFPDKWAIVQELQERFERGRGEYLAQALSDMGTSADWRPAAEAAWRGFVRFRVEVPGGVALRKAVEASPQLGDLEQVWVDRAARGFAGIIRARRPDVGEAEAYRAAWAASLVVTTLLDDVCASGEIDEAKLEMALHLMLNWFGLYLDPA